MRESMLARNAKAEAVGQLLQDGSFAVYDLPIVSAPTFMAPADKLIVQLPITGYQVKDGRVTFKLGRGTSRMTAKPAWFRTYTSKGFAVFDGDGEEMMADQELIYVGADVQVPEFVYDVPDQEEQ